MSAFQCSDFHLAIVSRFAAERIAENNQHIDLKTLIQDLANRLKRANIHSVNYRYSEKTPARKCRVHNTESKFSDIFPLYTAAHVYRLLECWNYQSCEDSNALDFHALSALLSAQFTPEEIEQSKSLELWAV